MLHQIGRVADDAGDQDHPGRWLELLEDVVLVLVAGVGRLERERPRLDPKEHVDDVLQRHVVHARAHVDAVAGVEAHALGRDAAQRVIDRLDAPGRPRPAFRHAQAGTHHVVGHQARVVDLEHEASVDDRPVLLVERVGQGLLVLLVSPVEAVGQRGEDVGRRDGRHEHLFVGPALHRDSEILDVGLHRGLAPVGDRPRADIDAELAGVAAPPEPFRDAIGPCVVVGEVEVLAARGTGAAFLPGRRRLALEAGEALHDVTEEARLALLAVGDDVEAGGFLQCDRFVDGPVFDALEVGGSDGLFAETLLRLEQICRAQQAADPLAADDHVQQILRCLTACDARFH